MQQQSYLQPRDNKSFTLQKRKCFIWETKCEKTEKKKKKVRVPLIPGNISKEASGSGCGWRESEGVSDSLIWFYYLSESGTRCRLTDQQDCESGSPISQWWRLADSSWWIFRTKGSPAWQSRLADELWNETDIQKLWAPPPPLPPTHPHTPVGQCDSEGCRHALKSVFHCDSGNLGWSVGHYRDTSTSLGTWPFNDRLWASSTPSFLLNIVLAALKWPQHRKIRSPSPKNLRHLFAD